MAVRPEVRQPAASRRSGRALLLAIVAPALLALVGPAAIAQTHRPARRGHAHAAPKKRKPVADAGAQGATSPGALPAGPSVAPSGGVTAGDAGANVLEAKTLDGGTHVFKFSELDIEGQLKSPQLVYFLRRVRAEFAAGDLGHRTFMREMSETRKESSF